MKKTIIFLFIISVPHILFGQDYYVSPDGSNTNNGLTEETAFQSIEYALQQIQPEKGNTLHLLPGNYKIYNTINVPKGINIKGEGETPEEVILMVNGDELHTAINLKESQRGGVPVDCVYGNQTISNFTINGNQKTRKGIVAAGRNNVKLLYLHVKNCIEHGIVLAALEADHQNQFFGKKIIGAQLAYCVVSECARRHPNSNDLYSSNIIIGGWHGGEMHDCTVYDREGDDHSSGQALSLMGLEFSKVYNNSFTTNANISNNWGGVFSVLSGYAAGVEFYNNTLNAGMSCEHRVDNDTMQIPGVKSMLIYNNRFIRDMADCCPTQAIELYPDNIEIFGNYFENFGSNINSWLGNDTLHNAIIHHNIFKGNGSGRAIKLTMGGNSSQNPDNHTVYQNFQIYNNIFDNLSNGIRNDHGQTKNFTIKNNVFMNIKDYVWRHDSEEDAINIVFDHNLTYNCNLQNDNSATFTNTLEEIDPGYAQTGDEPIEYYAVTGNDAAIIDAGVTINEFTAGFAGEAPDLGAYEKDGTVPQRMLVPIFAPLPDRNFYGQQSIQIINRNTFGKIMYTTDGSTPGKENGQEYTEPIIIDQPTTIKAVVVAENMISSHIRTMEYRVFDQKAAMPESSIASGEYDLSAIVKLSAPDKGSEIFYTTTGDIPDKIVGTKYESPIFINSSTVIKAIAYNQEMAASDIATFEYIINEDAEIPAGKLINDSNQSIIFSDDYWMHEENRGEGDIQDDIHTCFSQDSYFEYTFNGTGIAYICEKSNDKAEKIEIYLDGEYQTNLRLKSLETSVADTVFILLNLPAGEHTFRVVKSSLSGKHVLDALIVFDPFSFSLNKDELTLEPGETEQITATVDIYGSDNTTVNWASGDTNIATVDNNGLITAKNAGQTYILATIEQLSATDTCVINVTDETSVKSIEKSALNIRFNPYTNSLIINSEYKHSMDISVYIADISGKTIYNRSFTIQSGPNEKQLNTEQLSSGIYFIRLINKDGLQTVKKINYIK